VSMPRPEDNNSIGAGLDKPAAISHPAIRVQSPGYPE